MAKKLTQKEWNEKFLSEFSQQIDEFRHDPDKLLYGSITVTDEIKHQLNTIRKGTHSVQKVYIKFYTNAQHVIQNTK